MGEWKIVFDGKVEERPVTIKVFESNDTEDQGDGITVRVLTTSIRDDEPALEQNGNGLLPIADPTGTGTPITLEPADLDDLVAELLEIGFSHEAATQIVSEVLMADFGRAPTFEELQQSDGMPFKPEELAAIDRFQESFGRAPTHDEFVEFLEPHERQNFLQRFNDFFSASSRVAPVQDI
jgi:hypothetical protein